MQEALANRLGPMAPAIKAGQTEVRCSHLCGGRPGYQRGPDGLEDFNPPFGRFLDKASI